MSNRILVVEDDADTARIITLILKAYAYEVKAVSDGAAALFEAAQNPPDLIILDRNIPKLDGNEVSKRIKADLKLRIIPIIMISGMAGTEDKLYSLMNAGVDEYITKPFEPEELLAKVKSMLRLKKLNDELETKNSEIQSLYEKMSATADVRKQVLDDLLRGMPFAVLMADDSLNISEVNSNFYDLLEFKSDIKGRQISEVIPELKGFKEGHTTITHKLNSGALRQLGVSTLPLHGHGITAFLISDMTRELFLERINHLIKEAIEAGSENKYFTKIITEIMSFSMAEAASIYIFDGDNVYRDDIGASPENKLSSVDVNAYIEHLKKIVFLKTLQLRGDELKTIIKDSDNAINNILIMPLKGVKKSIGLIVLYNCREINSQGSQKLETLEFLASIISLIYENLMLINKVNHENIMIRSLINISKIINSTLDYERLIRTFMEVVAVFIDAQAVGIFLFDKNTDVLEHSCSQGFDETVVNAYKSAPMEKKEMADLEQFDSESFFKLPKFSVFKTGTEYVMHLKVQQKTIGFLLIRKINPDKIHLEMLALLTEYVAKAIENSFLFDTLVKQNKQLFDTAEILKKTEQRLILSEQLASTGKFAAAVAHEIRNPLTIMLGAVQSSRDASREEMAGTLEKLEDKIIDIDSILRQMTEIAKQIQITVADFDPSISVMQTLDFISKKAKVHKITVVTNFGHKHKVSGDRMWFERVLLNLYINAIDEMREGGELKVVTSDSGDFVIISVSDTGNGISEDIKDKLFEPFSTTKKHGTGLGLYNVKKAIELQGGKIDFTTGLTGTTFKVSLPKELAPEI